MKKLVLAGLAWWVGRWAAREAASLAGNRWLPRRRQDFDDPHAPGHMPGPFDE